MSVELNMLALSTVWLFVLILVATVFAQSQFTPAQLIGNRDDLDTSKGMVGRAKRTIENHKEALIMFAPFALIIALQDVSTSWTVLGAQIFFFSRLAHGIVYLIGIPYLRTLVWFTGIIGTGMVAWPIFF